MLIFLPVMLFSNSQKIPDNSPNTLPIILELNQLIFTETNDMRRNVT